MGRSLTFHIRADKTGPAPVEGMPWPTRGVELHGDLDGEVTIPTSFVRRHQLAEWLEIEDLGIVERPSRPDPGAQKGSTVVKPEHRLPVDGLPQPHVFRHVKKFVIHTLNRGDVTLRVVGQPDKYVDSDDPTEKVTPEIYAEGRTRVDHFYTCVQEA